MGVERTRKATELIRTWRRRYAVIKYVFFVTAIACMIISFINIFMDWPTCISYYIGLFAIANAVTFVIASRYVNYRHKKAVDNYLKEVKEVFEQEIKKAFPSEN